MDEGTETDAAWRTADFDDSKWKSGRVPLGYGDPGLGTEVRWGPDESSKFIATWFRRTFDRPELKSGERLVLIFCVDDGAEIYLNGQELGRVNMPDGPLPANTLASHALADSDEGSRRTERNTDLLLIVLPAGKPKIIDGTRWEKKRVQGASSFRFSRST